MTKRATRVCPNCGDVDSLEFFGSIWLDAVAIREADPQPIWKDADKTTWFEIVDADPATTADDDETGLMWSGDSTVRCKSCDHEVSYAPGHTTARFFDRYKMVKKATADRRARRERQT